MDKYAGPEGVLVNHLGYIVIEVDGCVGLEPGVCAEIGPGIRNVVVPTETEIRNVRIRRNRIEQSQVNPVGAARGVAIVALPRRASNAGPERHLVNQRRCDCADQVQGQVPGGIPRNAAAGVLELSHTSQIPGLHRTPELSGVLDPAAKNAVFHADLVIEAKEVLAAGAVVRELRGVIVPIVSGNVRRVVQRENVRDLIEDRLLLGR